MTADAADQLEEVNPRYLQARPSTMNLPIFAADDMERGLSAARSEQQSQRQQQQRGFPSRAASFFGRRLQQVVQNRGRQSTQDSYRDYQPWASRPVNSNIYNPNAAQSPSTRQIAANNRNAPITWDNTGVRGASGLLNTQAGNWGATQAGSSGNLWTNNKGDLSSLQALTGSTDNWSSVRAQPITATGTAGTLSQNMRKRGNARAAAQSLAQAYSAGQADAAAQAVASAATVDNSAEAVATAEAVSEATVNNPSVASELLAKSAGLAASRGQTNKYARTMANALKYAKQKQTVPQFTTAVADAIATGGPSTRYVYGQAIATAIAGGSDGKAAVAEATATAMCQGGSTAASWAQAYAVALTQNSQGCLVLNQAKALAKAKCGAQGAEAVAKADATSTVLGFCGLMDMIPGGISYNYGNSATMNNAYSGLLDSLRGK